MNTWKKIIFAALVIFISNHNVLFSQFLNKFGIKGGLNISKISTGEVPTWFFSTPPDDRFNLLTFDIGVFVEMFDSRFFCVSTELHYTRKGEENYQDVRFMYLDDKTHVADYRKIVDRFQFLSFQILPRWKYTVTSEDKLYIFVGPRFDLRLNNYNSRGNEDLTLKNSVFESGFTLGIGNEYWELFFLELRFDYNFTNAYKITIGNESVSRSNIAFSLLTGLSLKKLFKINL